MVTCSSKLQGYFNVSGGFSSMQHSEVKKNTNKPKTDAREV